MSNSPALLAAQFLLGVSARPQIQCLDRMLELAQATPLCVIAVAGPDAADAMAGLWKRGYDRVEAARCATCPSADQVADLLLVVGMESASQVGRSVHGMRAMLREGGLAVIDAGRMTDPDERLRLCGLLSEEGFACRPDAHLAPEILARKLGRQTWSVAA
ncbi:MAG: hypothetical protein Q7T61_01375 [Caulobacter sp.]|nr:hypothetical protein [Caulobacter sp.]